MITHKGCGGVVREDLKSPPYEWDDEDGHHGPFPVMRCLQCRKEIVGDAQINETIEELQMEQVNGAKPKDTSWQAEFGPFDHFKLIMMIAMLLENEKSFVVIDDRDNSGCWLLKVPDSPTVPSAYDVKWSIIP